jgi:hypothetical protein
MTAQTGRTIPDFTELYISNGAAMVGMKINNLGDIGLQYNGQDMSAWVDAVKGKIIGKPDFTLDFGGPVDNTATTGPSTILRAKVGSNTASSFDIRLGVRQDWVSGEQQFGLSAVVATNSGIIISNYVESGGNYKATMCMTAGSAVIPAYGTAAEVVPA